MSDIKTQQTTRVPPVYWKRTISEEDLRYYIERKVETIKHFSRTCAMLLRQGKKGKETINRWTKEILSDAFCGGHLDDPAGLFVPMQADIYSHLFDGEAILYFISVVSTLSEFFFFLDGKDDINAKRVNFPHILKQSDWDTIESVLTDLREDSEG